MDQHLIPLVLRHSSHVINRGSFPSTRESRRSVRKRISAPIPVLLSPESSPDIPLNLKRLSMKPMVPVKHPRRKDSIPKVYPLFQPPTLCSPYTRQDWEAAVEDVRRLYSKRRYQLCGERCIDILQNPQGPIHHIHSLYFSFYAAACLELQALRLHAKSTSRLSLLNHAKAYYEIAASYITYTEAATNVSLFSQQPEIHSRSCSLSSSKSSNSSLRTSIDSIYSQTSEIPSPASSVYDSDGLEREFQKFHDPWKPRPLTLPPKKRVSFRPSLPTVVSDGHMSAVDSDFEEYLFPNPPTLGRQGPTTKRKAISLPPGPPPRSPSPPVPIRSPNRPKAPAMEFPAPLPKTIPPKSPKRTSHGRALSFPNLLPVPETDRNRQERNAMIRYQSQLLSFRPQIFYHLSTISKLIHETSVTATTITTTTTMNNPSPTSWYREDFDPESPFDHPQNHHPNTSLSSTTTSSEVEVANINIFPFETHEGHGRAHRKNYLGFEMGLEEKRERIEEGRARMWVRRRGRFRGERYERLCERALMELGGGGGGGGGLRG